MTDKDLKTGLDKLLFELYKTEVRGSGISGYAERQECAKNPRREGNRNGIYILSRYQ